jgi:hypothetical protein
VAAQSGSTVGGRRRNRSAFALIPALGLASSGDEPIQPRITRPLLAREDKTFVHAEILSDSFNDSSIALVCSPRRAGNRHN